MPSVHLWRWDGQGTLDKSLKVTGSTQSTLGNTAAHVSLEKSLVAGAARRDTVFRGDWRMNYTDACFWAVYYSGEPHVEKVLTSVRQEKAHQKRHVFKDSVD